MPPAKTATEPSAALKSTLKVLAKMGVEDPVPDGAIPVYSAGHGHWLHVFNQHGIPQGAEHVADPAKVEDLRRRAAAVVGADTLDNLESLGYTKAKGILTSAIKKQADVIRWAESVFNWGPVSHPVEYPVPAGDVVSLALPSFQPLHPQGVVVIPPGPLDNGNKSVVVLDPGTTVLKAGQVLGPRHDISKAAWNPQLIDKLGEKVAHPERLVRRPVSALAPTKAPRAPKATTSPTTPSPTAGRRGRPRLDGLPPGSPEAKAADEKRKKDAAEAKAAARAARQAAKAPVKKSPPAPREVSSTIPGAAVVAPPQRVRKIPRRAS